MSAIFTAQAARTFQVSSTGYFISVLFMFSLCLQILYPTNNHYPKLQISGLLDENSVIFFFFFPLKHKLWPLTCFDGQTLQNACIPELSTSIPYPLSLYYHIKRIYLEACISVTKHNIFLIKVHCSKQIYFPKSLVVKGTFFSTKLNKSKWAGATYTAGQCHPLKIV